MKRILAAFAVSLVAGTTCAWAQSNWTPTVDTFGSSRSQYLSRDMWECRDLASNTSGSAGGSAVRGALRGGAVGAAGGAAIGAAFGNAGRRAAVGAAATLIAALAPGDVKQLENALQGDASAPPSAPTASSTWTRAS